VLIDFRELHGSHTGENLADVVWETLEKYGIALKVIAIVCDNASNNETMMRALEEHYTQRGVAFSAKWARIRCVPHILHLSATHVGDSELLTGAMGADVLFRFSKP
jgi:hypothetical protein